MSFSVRSSAIKSSVSVLIDHEEHEPVHPEACSSDSTDYLVPHQYGLKLINWVLLCCEGGKNSSSSAGDAHGSCPSSMSLTVTHWCAPDKPAHI